MNITYNGRAIEEASLVVEGIDRKDYPDFCDAYFSYAEYTDGTEVSDEGLESLVNDYPELLSEMVFDSLQGNY